MLENRSFDNLFGFLDHPSNRFPRFDPKDHPNHLDPTDPSSPVYFASPDGEYWLDPPDPPHSHIGVMEQLGVEGTRKARMNGFVAAAARKAEGREERPYVHWWRIELLLLLVATVPAGITARLTRSVSLPIWVFVYVGLAVVWSGVLYYVRRYKVDPVPISDPEVPERARQVMRCLSPEKIPVLATLAREFGVCTSWHCSVPGETWPNRNFVHAATSEGAVNIEAGFYHAPTIFDRLEEAGATWRIYYDGPPQIWAFEDLWSDDRCHRNWYEFINFTDHAMRRNLPNYSFIEPRHMRGQTNSQHPGNNLGSETQGESDFERGERLIATIYEALRGDHELFTKTLFVITYDEHGGLFDHVPPPRAPAPRLLTRRSGARRFVSWFIEHRRSGFTFRLLGPRVPAVVVSPWIERATVDTTTYDHTSVIATLRRFFAPDSKPLTRRDRRARAFDHLVTGRDASRTADNVPDLSRYAGVPSRVTATGPGAAMGAPPSRDVDDFVVQLDALSGLVRARLEEATPQAPGPRRLAAPPTAADRDNVVQADRLFAERARRVRAQNDR